MWEKRPMHMEKRHQTRPNFLDDHIIIYIYFAICIDKTFMYVRKETYVYGKETSNEP